MATPITPISLISLLANGPVASLTVAWCQPKGSSWNCLNVNAACWTLRVEEPHIFVPSQTEKIGETHTQAWNCYQTVTALACGTQRIKTCTLFTTTSLTGKAHQLFPYFPTPLHGKTVTINPQSDFKHWIRHLIWFIHLNVDERWRHETEVFKVGKYE